MKEFILFMVLALTFVACSNSKEVKKPQVKENSQTSSGEDMDLLKKKIYKKFNDAQFNYSGISKELDESMVTYGNKDSKDVYIFLQGGPETTVKFDTFAGLFGYAGHFDLEKNLLVNFREAQLKYGKTLNDRDINLDEAKACNMETISDLKDVIDFFHSKDKNVILFGNSFGSLVIQKYLATYGNNVESAHIIVTRLDADRKMQEARVKGITLTFDKNGNRLPIVKEPRVWERNQNRLIGAIIEPKYSEKFKDMDMSNLTYVVGGQDKAIGLLTLEEKEFLKKKHAKVVEYKEEGHSEAAMSYYRDFFPEKK